MHLCFLFLPSSTQKTKSWALPASFRLVLIEREKKTTRKSGKKERENASSKSQSTLPVSNKKKEALPIQGSRPVYPYQARIRGIEGDVVLKIHIDNGGVPSRIEMIHSSGYNILDQAAIKGVEKWRFDPASKNGVNIPFWIEKRFSFRLR